MVWAPSICLYSFNATIVLTGKKTNSYLNSLTWLGFYEEIIKSCMTFVGSIHPMEGSWCMRVVFIQGKFIRHCKCCDILLIFWPQWIVHENDSALVFIDISIVSFFCFFLGGPSISCFEFSFFLIQKKIWERRIQQEQKCKG